jgi:hypothetical protein
MTYVAIWVMKVCGIAYNIRLPRIPSATLSGTTSASPTS